MRILPNATLSMKLFASNPSLVWALFLAAIGRDSTKYPPKLYFLSEVWGGVSGGSTSGGSQWQDPNYTEEGYERRLSSIKIAYEGDEKHELVIYHDWRFFFYQVHAKGELKGWSMANGEEYYTENKYNTVAMPCPQMITELLLKHHLFKIV